METKTGKAHKIVPEIVARWNRSKGRVDEMTRYLDGMTFPVPKGTPKQMLVMHELKKMAVNVQFILKLFQHESRQLGEAIRRSKTITNT